MPVELLIRRARFGAPAPRDKDHDRASRKSRREKTTQSPKAGALAAGIDVDDPVADDVTAASTMSCTAGTSGVRFNCEKEIRRRGASTSSRPEPVDLPAR